MKVELQNGGSAEVTDNELVVDRPGREPVVVDLRDVKDVSFTLGARVGDPGAVVVYNEAGPQILLRVLEKDGLDLVAALRAPVFNVVDSDAVLFQDV